MDIRDKVTGGGNGKRDFYLGMAMGNQTKYAEDRVYSLVWM